MMLFSDLVDDIASMVARKGEESLIAGICNGAFRELQGKGFFDQDLVEAQLDTAGASTQPFMWRDIPRNLRAIQYVRYANGVSPVPTKLGRKLQSLAGNFYYIAGNYIAFSGAPQGAPINIAYYRLLPRLVYYADRSEQPAQYIDDKWWYRVYDQDTLSYKLVPDLGSWEANNAAQEKVVNWILEDYYEAVKAVAVREVANLFEDTVDSSVWTAIARNHTDTFINLCLRKGIYT